MPKVSIVLPFRDAASTLDECLTSIRAQTLEDWELVAIDDGSADDSAMLIARAAETDHRVRLLSPGRRGLVAALNVGLAESRSDLIARMDADDRMATERLALQAAHLERAPDIGLVSCQVRLFPDEAILAGWREYIRWQNQCLTPDDVADEIYVESPFAHPSVMFRRSAVLDAGGYRDGDFPEDYELWLRLHERGLRMDKLASVLLDWRESQARMSRTDSRYSRLAFDRLRADYLSRDRRVTGPRPVVFWGAGRRTRQRSRELVQRGVRPAAYIDIDPKKIGRTIDDVLVHPPDWLDRDDKPFVLVQVTNHGARDLIAGKLRELGFRRGQDWIGVG